MHARRNLVIYIACELISVLGGVCVGLISALAASVYVAVISVVAGVVGVMARPASKHSHIRSG